jgi:hypothetical protein
LPDVADLAQTIRSSATGPVLVRAPAFAQFMLTFVRERSASSTCSAAASVGRASTVYGSPVVGRSSTRALSRPTRGSATGAAARSHPLPPAGSRLATRKLGEIGGEVLRRPPARRATPPGGGDATRSGTSHPRCRPCRRHRVTPRIRRRTTRAYAPVLARKHGSQLPPDSSLLTWSGATTAFAIERRRRTVLCEEAGPTRRGAGRGVVEASAILTPARRRAPR